MEMLGWRLCYGSSTSYLMTWLWIPHASSRSSTYECVGPLRTFHPLLTSRFTFQHLPAFVFCLFCVVVWFCCFGVFLFPVCECLGIPNSPRSLDLDDRQGLIARSAMQQKKKLVTECFRHNIWYNKGAGRRFSMAMVAASTPCPRH